MPIIHKKGRIQRISLLQKKQKIKPVPVAEFLKRRIKQSDKTLFVGPADPIVDPTTPFVAKNIGAKNMWLLDSQKHDFELGSPWYGGIHDHQREWRENKKRLGLPKEEPQRVLGNALNMPLKPASFDKIVDHCSFDEIEEPPHSKLFREYLRVLKPQGKAFVFGKYRKNPVFRKEKMRKAEEQRKIIENDLKSIDPNVKVEILPVTDKIKDYNLNFAFDESMKLMLKAYKGNVSRPASYVFVITKMK